ncbi:MAG TPA: DJ-1/PfpI family protein [Anaerolineales bacterium]|nr:DJ-1/PfpI family protein [Anaerolineales bacterium]
MSLSIAIFIFDDVEVLDFAGPLEVFYTASRVAVRLNQPQPFEVFSVAQSTQPTRTRANLQVQAHYTFQNHPPVDVLIVPGGVVTAELEKPAVLAWLAQVDAHTQLTASVCTGAFLLAKLGLLAGKQATTHWEDIPDLQAFAPETAVRADVPWVDNGRIVTSAGIAAGIGMSLHLVERLAGRELAVRTARQMQFDWE